MTQVSEVNIAIAEKLRAALEGVDDYLAGQIRGVVESLVSVANDSEGDPRARVAAAGRILDYVRPPKGVAFGVNINLPGVVSALELPPGPGEKPKKGKNPKLVEAAVVKPRHPKILPEPNPIHKPSFRPVYQAGRDQPVPEPILAMPSRVEARLKIIGQPEQPPPASGIRPIPGQ